MFALAAFFCFVKDRHECPDNSWHTEWDGIEHPARRMARRADSCTDATTGSYGQLMPAGAPGCAARHPVLASPPRWSVRSTSWRASAFSSQFTRGHRWRLRTPSPSGGALMLTSLVGVILMVPARSDLHRLWIGWFMPPGHELRSGIPGFAGTRQTVKQHHRNVDIPLRPDNRTPPVNPYVARGAPNLLPLRRRRDDYRLRLSATAQQTSLPWSGLYSGGSASGAARAS